MRLFLVFYFLMIFLFSSAVYANTFVFVNNNPVIYQPARFVSSSPADHQTLDKAPGIVTITFSGPISADKSSIGVYDLYGTQLDTGAVTVTGVAMSAKLPADLPPGKYAVKWKTHCQCADNIDLNDEFHFTVR